MSITTIKQLVAIIRADSQRYRSGGGKILFRNLMIPGFRFTFFLRICSYLKNNNNGILYKLFYFILRHYKYKYGYEIHPTTDIAPGFYIGHFGGIVINHQAKLGYNINISQGVTIGSNNRGLKCGCPVIGNNVYIGPGAKIIGNIRIGDNVAIGANAVVVNNVIENCCVGGIPAKIISNKGSGAEYIQNPIDIIEYEKRIKDKIADI